MSDEAKTTVGRVVFGPVAPQTAGDWASRPWRHVQGATVHALSVQPCNCIGPQLGQSKCPCALRVEMEQASRMVREGVEINGRRYRLAPED